MKQRESPSCIWTRVVLHTICLVAMAMLRLDSVAMANTTGTPGVASMLIGANAGESLTDSLFV